MKLSLLFILYCFAMPFLLGQGQDVLPLPEWPADKDSLAKKHIAKLQWQGFPEARVTSVKQRDDSLYIYYVKGPQYQWLQLKNGNVPSYVLSQMAISPVEFQGELFKYNKLLEIKEQLIRYYENNGYPFARVFLDSVQIKDSMVAATINVDSYLFFSYDSLIVRGKGQINEGYLRRFLQIEKGRRFRQEDVRKIDNRLGDISFISVIRPARVLFKSGDADVYLFLDERPANSIDGMIGLLSGEDDEPIQLVGELALHLQNVLGGGEIFDLQWRKLSGPSQKMDIGIVYPYIAGSRLGADFTFNLFKKDSSYLNYETDVGLRFYHEGENYFRLFWNAEASDPISGLDQNDHNLDFAKFRKNYFGLGVFQNQLDKKLNPSSGLLFDARLAYGNVRRWLKETEKNSELKAKLDMSFFIPVSKSMTIHLRNQTAFIHQYSGKNDSAGAFLSNELFRIGGLNTLRGFDEESIFAHWYTVGTFEYRFLLDQASSFFIFYDQAFYEAMYQDKQFVQDTPLGLGIGFHLSTPAGLLRLNYAFGKQFGNSLDIRAGKIHLGISTRF